jgi:hypothetical protein
MIVSDWNDKLKTTMNIPNILLVRAGKAVHSGLRYLISR